jgi:hypothetical protein
MDPYKEGITLPPTDQKVLLIDYTGYRCGNCPKGADEAARLHDLYGDKLVVVAMHVGSQFARPDPAKQFIDDFRTNTGEALYDFIGRPGQPAGSVNLIKDGIGYSVNVEQWAAAISKQLRNNPTMNIAITPLFSSDSILTVKAEVKYKKASTGNHRIAIYLIEDSVVYRQIDYRLLPNDDIIPDYVHRHVMRGAISGGKLDGKFAGTSNISGAFGELLPATVANATTSKTYSISLKGMPWNLKHCSVIVQVNDKTTNATLQVEEAKIIK